MLFFLWLEPQQNSGPIGMQLEIRHILFMLFILIQSISNCLRACLPNHLFPKKKKNPYKMHTFICVTLVACAF